MATRSERLSREDIVAQRRAGRALARKLALTDKVSASSKEKKMSEVQSEAPKPLFVCTSTLRGPMQVIVVGAGGTGARVVPPLMQMLRPGDSVAILDHDIVEDRNLLRQHFTSRDIGQPKALVLGERYRREGINSLAFQQQMSEANVGDLAAQVATSIREQLGGGARPVSTVILGCVDNAAARRAMNAAYLVHAGRWGTNHLAWIDVGNEMRAGQVLLSLRGWPVKVSGPTGPGFDVPVSVNMEGLRMAMPQLLRDEPAAAAQEGCAVRLDLQTVQVNHMAAAAVINTLSWLLLGIPFTSCGAFFSTLNTMQPIRIVGNSGYSLLPEVTHAISA